jgi:DNA-binding NarL/FixJ family response regulator
MSPLDESTARVRVLWCGATTPDRDALLGIVAELEHFELVGETETVAGLVAMTRTHRPDVLILDGSVPGGGVDRVARSLALERPLPILVIVDDENLAIDRDTFRNLRIYRLDRQRLRRLDHVDRSFIRTRLNLLAARANEPKHTLPSSSLADVVLALREEEADAYVSPSARKLTADALDMVLLAGGRESVSVLGHVIPHVQAVHVPVLLALEHEHESSAVEPMREYAARTRLPIAELVESLPIRRMNGVMVTPPNRSVSLVGETVRVGTGVLDLERLLRSMEMLGPSGLSVLLCEGTTNGARGLATAAQADGHTAVLSYYGTTVEAVKSTGYTATEVTPRELAWILGAAAPRRV